MVEDRANTFLRMIRRAQRGRLKVYLGYCAGVGKTYQMLQEGHRLKEDGIDVVIGRFKPRMPKCRFWVFPAAPLKAGIFSRISGPPELLKKR